MYFPYLRGKQQELIALREAMPIIRKSRVLPIVEPIGASASAVKSLGRLAGLKLPMTFVTNPQVGKFKEKPQDVDGLLEIVRENENTILAYIIHSKSTLADVRGFFNAHAKRQKSLIHLHDVGAGAEALIGLCGKQDNFAHHIFFEGKTGETYNARFRDFQTVLIEDGFNRENATKNADRDEEIFFSELHSTHRRKGYAGYGDFTITGKDYREKGGAAQAVAIHLTYQRKTESEDQIRIRNFISDRTEGAGVDTEGKYFEALEKFVKFVTSPHSKAFRSTGVEEFLKSHKTAHYPGLGSIKGWSIRHHIELMASL